MVKIHKRIQAHKKLQICAAIVILWRRRRRRAMEKSARKI